MNDVVVKITKDNDIEKNVVVKEKNFYRKKNIRLFINIIYFLFVFSLLTWKAIYSFYKAIDVKDIRYLTSSIFTALFVVQFILGTIYYKDNHFQRVMKRNRHYKKYILNGFKLIICLSLIISIASVVLLITDKDINIFSELYENSGTIEKNIFY